MFDVFYHVTLAMVIPHKLAKKSFLHKMGFDTTEENLECVLCKY